MKVKQFDKVEVPLIEKERLDIPKPRCYDEDEVIFWNDLSVQSISGKDRFPSNGIMGIAQHNANAGDFVNISMNDTYAVSGSCVFKY